MTHAVTPELTEINAALTEIEVDLVALAEKLRDDPRWQWAWNRLQECKAEAKRKAEAEHMARCLRF